MAGRAIAAGAVAFVGFGALVNAAANDSGAAVTVTNSVGIPPRSLGAYQAAAPQAPAGCQMRWQIIAGVSAIESGHGTFSGDGIDRSAGPLPDGKAVAPIIGPALDGGEFALIWDTDDGVLDGDRVYDRAVGFTQAIPETWRRVMAGRPDADPQDIDDAAVFTALELCRAAGGPITVEDNLRRALYAYNQDSSYVAEVMLRIAGYDAAGPTGAPTVVQSGDPSLDQVVDLAQSRLDRVWTEVEQNTSSENRIVRWLKAPVRVLTGGGKSKTAVKAGAHALPVDGLTAADIDTTHHDYPAWDLGIDEGTAIYATAPGTATVIDDPAGCGNGVRVVTADGWAWTSCHLSTVNVATGAQVSAGQIIGRSGNTGRSTGPHLHLQVRNPAGELVCPQPALAAWLGGNDAVQPNGTECTH